MNGEKGNASEEMFNFASTMWRRFFRRKVKEMSELRHSLLGYKAQVVTNNGDGTLTVQRPFESTTLTLRCSASLSGAVAGDPVLIVALGGLENAFILCKTDFSNL